MNFSAMLQSSLFSMVFAATLVLNVKFNKVAATTDNNTREILIILDLWI